MNGREIFNFSATRVPEQILRLLIRDGLDVSDVNGFIFHQGSKFIVDTIAKKLRLPKEKIFTNMDFGNTVSSSIPLIIEKQVLNSEKRGRYLISGFGVGLSYASGLLEWEKS